MGFGPLLSCCAWSTVGAITKFCFSMTTSGLVFMTQKLRQCPLNSGFVFISSQTIIALTLG